MRLSIFLFFLLFISSYSLQAQNCPNLIVENKTLGSSQILKSKDQTIVIRGTYSYSIEFNTSTNGIVAKVYSNGGVEFNQDDEIIFTDVTKKRQSYRFVEMGEVKKSGNTPIFINTLQLDMAAIEWFANSPINTLYLRNNVTNKMLKLTVTSNRQADFKNLAKCFNSSLDRGKVKDVKLTNNNFSPKPNGKSSGSPISATSAGGRRITDVSLLNDKELADLKQELATIKGKLREEINLEREKADKIKSQIKLNTTKFETFF